VLLEWAVVVPLRILCPSAHYCAVKEKGTLYMDIVNVHVCTVHVCMWEDALA